MYYFSELALTLNEQEEGVAPTDSRLRPDQRLMEKGHWDQANMEKQRLEEKQRISRRRRLESCSQACGTEEGEEASGTSGTLGVQAERVVGDGLPGTLGLEGIWGTCPPAPLCPPSRKGDGCVHAAVVREEAGPADWRDGLHVQRRLLGSQGEAGLAYVPQHLLSTILPANTGACTAWSTFS